VVVDPDAVFSGKMVPGESEDNPDRLQSALAGIEKIRGVSFDWRKEGPLSGRDIGVIAQEVETVFPELVSRDSEGQRMVNYAGLVAVLIEAVKELDERLAALERRLAETDQA
jgi:hypothetical protein